MHVVLSATTPDADPRSYYGGTAETQAGQVCCGSQQASPAAQILAGLDAADLFPTLVLGSLPGYKTEILHSYWKPGLAAEILDAATGYAQAQGIATIVAPWVADRGSGKALARELKRRGAVTSFWAVEDYRYGQDVADTEAPQVLARLLELGVPLVAVGGFRDSQLVACCVSLGKGDRIYAKYAGFDYDTLGTRSGAYFAVVRYGTLAAAYDRKARVVEYGIGGHRAKAPAAANPATSPATCLPTGSTSATPSAPPPPSTLHCGAPSTPARDPIRRRARRIPGHIALPAAGKPSRRSTHPGPYLPIPEAAASGASSRSK